MAKPKGVREFDGADINVGKPKHLSGKHNPPMKGARANKIDNTPKIAMHDGTEERGGASKSVRNMNDIGLPSKLQSSVPSGVAKHGD